ncbi:hypothetical protein [Sphingorhabdus sp.]|jgi:hypothetical protein|uniref:hypothetical protein n=1 Tax=Sphingorhabdus sp. TaxID=1902408 RepID=UPI0037CADAD9
MTRFNDFWVHMFGEDISNFEEILLVRGACLLKPEEPLFAIFAAMVRLIHQSQGDLEKALLQFAPELTDRAHSMIESADGLNQQLEGLHRRSQEISSALHMLEARNVGLSINSGEQHGSGLGWVEQNLEPIAVSALVFTFCAGFVTAAYIYI